MFDLDCEKAFRARWAERWEESEHGEVEALGGRESKWGGWTECRQEIPHGKRSFMLGVQC